MRNIINYINKQSTTTVKPKTKEELISIINDRILKKGYKCNLNDIDVSDITDMKYLFVDSNFNGNVSKWDVSNVTTMRGMFAGSDFTGDLSKWDVSNVIYMNYMFEDTVYNKNISMWNVSNVKRYQNIFRNCPLEYKVNKQPKFNK
jgi:surface protein